MSEVIERPAIDKSTWGPGEWQSEPDRHDWIAHGFACFALRHPHGGHWCGYVGVPRSHSAYGKPYDDVAVDVHGGLTYSDSCRGDICHVPAPGMPDDVWWFGFDFAHGWDLAPGYAARSRELDALMGTTFADSHFLREEEYRDLPYVVAETSALALQLAGGVRLLA